MIFHHGQSVWVGWCPDSRTDPRYHDCRCRIGTVVAGPFDGTPVRAPAWRVAIDDRTVLANERLLTPFDDDIALESHDAEATA